MIHHCTTYPALLIISTHRLNMSSDYSTLSKAELVSLLRVRDITVANLREHVLVLERQRTSAADAFEDSADAYNTDLVRRVGSMQGASEIERLARKVADLEQKNEDLEKTSRDASRRTGPGNGGTAPTTNIHVGTFTGNVYYNNYYPASPYQANPTHATAHGALPLRPAATMASSSASHGATALQHHRTAVDAVTAVAIANEDYEDDRDTDVRAPRYSNPCERETRRVSCRMERCGYLHRCQIQRYQALLSTLPANAAQEREGNRRR
jgi:hypothetical protein